MERGERYVERRSKAEAGFDAADGDLKAAKDLLRERPVQIDEAMKFLDEAEDAYVKAYEAYSRILEEGGKLSLGEVRKAYVGAMDALQGQAELAAKQGDAGALRAVADEMSATEARFDQDDRVLDEDAQADVSTLLKKEKVSSEEFERWVRRARVLASRGANADALLSALQREVRACRPARIAIAPWTGWEKKV